MSWNLTLGDYIGVELPFIEPPTLPVPLDITVDFPDADPMGVYVFPALYYELYGPGIDSTPQLLNQDASAGGTITVLGGAEKMRVYVRYSAQPGPLGTLPHGDIRRSLMSIKAGGGLSIPSLGTRVHELILDVGATRITMVEETVLAVPPVSGATDLEPMVASEVFVYTDATLAYYWVKFPLVERPVTDLGLRRVAVVTNAVHPAVVRNESNTAAGVAGTYAYRSTLGSSGISIWIQNNADVLAQPVNVPGSTTGQLLIEQGSKAIFLAGKLLISEHNTFMADLANNPVGHNYCRLHLEAVNTPTLHRGKNWRIPAYTYADMFFTGRDVTEAPWHDEVPSFVF